MASVNDINFLPPIDLTARDYLSIKSALIQHVQTFFPNDWQDFTESGLGTILLELVAYVGDQLSFYLDRQGNETFLPTAVQRQNVLNLVTLVGYVPRSVAAAVADLTATLQTAQANAVVVPAFTSLKDEDNNDWELLEAFEIPVGRTSSAGISIADEVLGQGDGSTKNFAFLVDNENISNAAAELPILKVTITTIQYQLTVQVDGTVQLPFGGTGLLDFDTGEFTLNFVTGKEPDSGVDILLTYSFSQDIKAYQGLTKLDVFSSDGSPGQEHTLSFSPVLVSPIVEEVEIEPNPNRFEVWIGDPDVPFGNGTGSLWSRVDSLATAGPTEEVYAIKFDSQDRVIVQFGDNNAGATPPVGTNNVQIVYRTGGGSIGNVAVGRVNASVTGQSGLFAVTVSITNPTPTSGGRERESLDEMRINAPAFLRTNNTATTEQDFDTLALFSRSGLGAVVRAKSRLTPELTVTSNTVSSAFELGVVPVGAPLEYFLLLPGTPAIVSSFILNYTVGGVLRSATASDLGSGLADLLGDTTVDPTSRWRYDEQNFSGELFAFANGTTFNFTDSFAGFPVFPGSVTFVYTIGGQTFTGFDDGNGNIIGTGLFDQTNGTIDTDNTIDYATGAVELNFGTQPVVVTANAENYDMAAENDPSTMTITIDGGSAQTITFDSTDPLISTFSAITAEEVRDVINDQLTGGTAEVLSGTTVQVSSDTIGSNSSIQVTDGPVSSDANNVLGFPTTLVSGQGTAPDSATAIQVDYQSCLNLKLNNAPDVGSEILVTVETGPNVITLPTNNIEVYTWAEDPDGNLTAPSPALRDTLKNDLDTKRVLATSVEVLAGFNVKVHYNLTVTFDSSSDQTEVTQTILAAVEEFFQSVVNVQAGTNVPLAAVYDAVYPLQGVIDLVITDVRLSVPVATGDGFTTVFKNSGTTPGQFVSSGKLPAKSGIDQIRVFRNTTEIGASDATSPVAALSGSEVVGSSTFNVTSGAFDIRVQPAIPNDEVVLLDFFLDDDVSGQALWNIDINEWEIATLGDVTINGIKVN
jgi:hypothetical protein